MVAGILSTNNGPHDADKWAVLTAGQIVNIVDSTSIEGRSLELKLLAKLKTHHSTVMASERGKLHGKGVARLIENPDPNEQEFDIDEMLADICTVGEGTAYEAHFADPQIQLYIKGVLQSHFATVMDIERSWYCDNLTQADIHSPSVVAYRKARGR